MELFPPFCHFLHFSSEYFPQHSFFLENKNYRPNETEYLPDLIYYVILFSNEVLTFDAITQQLNFTKFTSDTNIIILSS